MSSLSSSMTGGGVEGGVSPSSTTDMLLLCVDIAFLSTLFNCTHKLPVPFTTTHPLSQWSDPVLHHTT